MRKTLCVAVMVGVAATAGAQQPSSPAYRTTKMSAASGGSASPAAPLTGFTEAQAKSRIEAEGYAGVTGLKKDRAGVWRGMAKRGERIVAVSVDFEGNVAK